MNRVSLPPLAEHRFRHAGWLIIVTLAEHAPALTNGCADMSKDGVHACRVTTIGFKGGGAAAIAALMQRARSTIDEMACREKPGLVVESSLGVGMKRGRDAVRSWLRLLE